MRSERAKHRRRRPKEIYDKYRDIDRELISFYDFCGRMGFSTTEMDVICEPVNELMVKHGMRNTWAKGFVALLLVICALYTTNQIVTLTTHTAAITRIALIKALPFWDWRYLYNEHCLVDNPLYVAEQGLSNADCMICESIDSVNVLSQTDYKSLLDNYLNRETPVIVSDATDDWMVMNSLLLISNITQAFLKDDYLYHTVPCTMKTNLQHDGSDLQSVLKLINNDSIGKWFVNWQNCDILGVKALRKFYQKPYFLPNTISPAHFNWVFMSSDYNSKHFKKIDLDPGLIMYIQLRGSTQMKILPIKPCDDTCSDLFVTIHEGEILILKNYLWNLEYLPENPVDNIAILTETAWDQNLP